MSQTSCTGTRRSSRSPVRTALGRLLSLLSLCGFWVIPFSPILAIAAIHLNTTPQTWSRRLALLAGWLCTLYTIALTAWMLLIYAATLLTSAP